MTKQQQAQVNADFDLAQQLQNEENNKNKKDYKNGKEKRLGRVMEEQNRKLTPEEYEEERRQEEESWANWNVKPISEAPTEHSRLVQDQKARLEEHRKRTKGTFIE